MCHTRTVYDDNDDDDDDDGGGGGDDDDDTEDEEKPKGLPKLEDWPNEDELLLLLLLLLFWLFPSLLASNTIHAESRRSAPMV